MHTPAHVFVNLFILKRTSSIGALAAAIAIGAALPDMPATVFYPIHKFIYQIPETTIWQTLYPDSSWALLTAIGHSFPIFAALGFVMLALRIRWAAILCLSIILHSVFDFLTHNFDAHAHLFPLSQYRFISPLSYWDANHFGLYFGLFELVGVVLIFALFWKSKLYRLWMGIGLALYLASYAYSIAVWS